MDLNGKENLMLRESHLEVLLSVAAELDNTNDAEKVKIASMIDVLINELYNFKKQAVAILHPKITQWLGTNFKGAFKSIPETKKALDAIINIRFNRQLQERYDLGGLQPQDWANAIKQLRKAITHGNDFNSPAVEIDSNNAEAPIAWQVSR